MILRDYYNNQYKNNFYLYVEFIKDHDETGSFENFLLRPTNEVKLSFEDLSSPLYDYLYKSLFIYLEKNINEQYNFSFLYEFFEKDFLNLFLSKEGESLMQDNNIYDYNNNPISIEKEAVLSKEQYDDFDVSLNITKDASYNFIEKYKNLEGYKYIKEVLILSKIRKFINLGGATSFFSEADENSFVMKMFNIIQNGVFCDEDINAVLANKTYFENVFYYDYD